MPRERLLTLLAEVRRELEMIYCDRLAGVYLYGSYARGEANEDSDIDIAVVLRGDVSPWKERALISDALGEISLRENCLLTAIYVPEEDWKRARYAVHRSIRRDGIAI